MILVAYLVVFVLAATPFFEVVGVIPIGVAAGLSSIPVTLISCLGNLLTIWLLIVLIDRIKQWMQKRKEKQGKESSGKRQQRAAKIWQRYGLPGLALISPILIGSHLGAILAMGFGAGKKQVTIWMTASIVVWAIAAGVISHYGIDYLFSQTGREGFLIDFLRSTQ